MHKTIDTYMDVEKPEEKKNVGVIEYPEETVKKIYSLWKYFVIKNKDVEREEALEEAIRIIGKHSVPGRVVADINEQYRDGLFYTALLNTGVARVTITKVTSNVACCENESGYCLQRGILEVRCHSEGILGELGDGGCIINYGDTWGLGTRATNGVFINHGNVIYLGNEAKGGFFVNHGVVCTYELPDMAHFGYEATGGTFVNLSGEDYFVKVVKESVRSISVPKNDTNTKLGKLLTHLSAATQKEGIIELSEVQEVTYKIEKEIRRICHKMR